MVLSVGFTPSLSLAFLIVISDLPCLPEIRGIATSRPETAQKVKEETGVAFVTSSFSELINREDIDIVVVALPNVLHQEVVNKAARAKKAIYCDKPLSSNLKGALAMEEVEKKRMFSWEWFFRIALFRPFGGLKS